MYSELLRAKIVSNTIRQLKGMNAFDREAMVELVLDPIEAAHNVQAAYDLYQSMKPTFELPDESVDGPIRFALTEDNKPVGMYPHECHTLIAGQTRTGKSTLLKILFALAISLDETDE